MAKAPWARFTKFISPRVTASPQASTKSSMPYAMPSNRIVNMVVIMGAGPRSMNDNHPQLLHAQRAGLSVSQIALPAISRPNRSPVAPYGPSAMERSPAISFFRFAGVLDGFEGLEFDVVEFTVNLFDLTDIDILYDIAGLRVDRDRAARAFPLQSFHGFDQRVAVRLAPGLSQRFIDQVDAVIPAHGHEARARPERLFVARDEFLVHRGGMCGRIQMRGDGAQRRVPHAVQQIVIHNVARSDDLDTRLIQ